MLLACSRCKRLDLGVIPAIERYDGPAFRLLRRFLAKNPASSTDIKILSAEYGLISTDYLLPYYDCRITKERAKILHPQVISSLKTILSNKSYVNILILLGQDYLGAVYGYEAIIPNGVTVQLAKGGIGRKLSVLYDWLYGNPSNLRNNQRLASTKSRVRIRGIELNLTAEQILDTARQAILVGTGGASRYQSWYVPVDDQKVAPKWLVSQITGLPVSNFVTDDARRVLTQLGVEVKRL